jgi:HEAT repeat protein
MKAVSCVAVIVASMLFLACASCGEQSAEDYEKSLKDGKFNQEESLKALESNSEYKRQVAAEFLGKLGDSKVIPPLVRHMHNDPSIKVRKICLNALLSRNDAALVPEFIKILRQKAVYALGELRTDEGYNALLEMLADTEPEVRISAIQALGKFEKKEVLEKLAVLFGDENVTVAQEAAKTVAEVGQADAIDFLMTALDRDDVYMRRIAVSKLGEFKARKAAVSIIPLLESDNASLREDAARALGMMRERSAIEPLIKHITDPHPDVRRAVVEALGAIGGIEQLDELIALLEDGDSDVRELALDALIKMKVQSDSFKAKLQYMAVSDPHTRLREKAREALDAMK